MLMQMENHQWNEGVHRAAWAWTRGGSVFIHRRHHDDWNCLAIDTAKGNRPSFDDAATPEEAEPLYRAFCDALRELDVEVATGVFGARMAVELVNDGPVTIVLGG